jgi:hypothetical protein
MKPHGAYPSVSLSGRQHPKRADDIPTVAAAALLCPRLHRCHRAAHSLTAAPLSPPTAIKGAPPLREQPFSSSAPSLPLRRHANIIEPPQTATPVPLRTSRHRPELRTDAGSSLDPLAGALSCSSAPPLSLPAARFAPPWNPCSDEPSPLLDRQSSPPPYRLALRPLHRRPAGFCRQVTGADGGENLPWCCLGPQD